jgi:peptidyl-prolyl cis-trans isomerase D
MLQSIRNQASSFVVKILFGALIVSFGVWGIGDIFRGRGTDTTVASVGGKEISAAQVDHAVRSQMERLRSIFGNSLDLTKAKQLGLVDAALQQIIGSNLIDLEIDRLHLSVGDEAVRQAILSNPNFRNSAGAFDRNVYQRVLAANNLSEPQYEAMLREEIARSHLTGALAAGMTPPPELTDALYRAEAERRVADVATLPASAVGAMPQPSDQQLQAYYKAHGDEFRTPELRSFTAALLRVDDVAAGIKVPDDKLHQEYQARAAEFHTPEERHLEQMLLPDEAKAKAAEAALTSGRNFATVAKDIAKEDKATLDLGWVKQGDLPKALGDAAFSLKAGETSKPLQTSLGWHILHVAEVKPAATQPFDAVKDKLTKEAARDMAGDQIADTANKIDDALAGGASLQEVAQKFDLKTVTVTGVDAKGVDANDKPVDLPQPSKKILQTAFNTNAGQTSDLTDMGEAGYYLVKVDKITPATVKPLDQVREKATKLWQDEQRSEALAKLAGEIAKEVDGGKSLKDVAAARKLTLTTTEPLERTGGNAKVPPALVAKLFTAKPDKAVTAPADDSYVVAQLKEIVPADPAKNKEAVERVSQQLGFGLQNDLLTEFSQALRAEFPVKIDRAKLDRLL